MRLTVSPSISNARTAPRKPFKSNSEKWCEVQGRKGHASDECLTLRKLKEKS